MLQNAGFSDIRLMPSSFMIRAKDQSGNPVVMSVSPDSVTEVAEIGTSGSNGTAGSANSSDTSGTSQFVTIGQNDELSSNLVGLDVYNSQKQDIGQIKDVAMGPQGRTQALILSVGGFLGMGEHYVAVNPSDVKVSYNNSDQKWHASTSATTAELKAAPQFQYNGRWNASKS
jgi:sporulation protein YlmC with PRC-barrel domain